MHTLILFDWDGTLGDSSAMCRLELRETLRRMGLPQHSDETYDLCNGPTIEASAPIVGVPPERVEEYVQLRQQVEIELLPQVLSLYPGVREMLDDLAARADLAVISNGEAGYIGASVDQTDTRRCFTRISAHRAGLTKAENMRCLLAELQPDRAIMVGDRFGDIEAGHLNGLPAAAAIYGCGTREELAPAEYAAESAPALHALLLDWLAQA